MQFDDVIKQMTDRGATQITISPAKDGKTAVGVFRNGTPYGDSAISAEQVAVALVTKLDEAIAQEKAIAEARAKAEADAKAAREKLAADVQKKADDLKAAAEAAKG